MIALPMRVRLDFLGGTFLIAMCGLVLILFKLIFFQSLFGIIFLFTISMAMFGMTAGSLLVYFRPHFFPPQQLFETRSDLHGVSLSADASILLILSTVVIVTSTTMMTVLLWLSSSSSSLRPMSRRHGDRRRSRAVPSPSGSYRGRLSRCGGGLSRHSGLTEPGRRRVSDDRGRSLASLLPPASRLHTSFRNSRAVGRHCPSALRSTTVLSGCRDFDVPRRGQRLVTAPGRPRPHHC